MTYPAVEQPAEIALDDASIDLTSRKAGTARGRRSSGQSRECNSNEVGDLHGGEDGDFCVVE